MKALIASPPRSSSPHKERLGRRLRGGSFQRVSFCSEFEARKRERLLRGFCKGSARTPKKVARSPRTNTPEMAFTAERLQPPRREASRPFVTLCACEAEDLSARRTLHEEALLHQRQRRERDSLGCRLLSQRRRGFVGH